MGACFKKKKKPNSTTINSNEKKYEPNDSPEQDGKPIQNENDTKKEEQQAIHTQPTADITSGDKKPPPKLEKGASKKNLKIDTNINPEKNPFQNVEKSDYERHLEEMQEIVKYKQEIIKKKNQELVEIQAHKEIFLQDFPSANIRNDPDSAELIQRRIMKFMEKNIEASKNLENFNKELESYSVGIRRAAKGSASSEEIKSSVRKALSRMAFDKDLQNSNSAGSIINSSAFSFSPLKVPKTQSKVIDPNSNLETPLKILKQILKVKNNEMDKRSNFMEKAKKGEAVEEEIRKYQEEMKKELEVDLDNLDVILGQESE